MNISATLRLLLLLSFHDSSHSALESIAPLATTLIPSRARTSKYVRKLNCLVALMLDIVDVFVWYPDTKGRRLHSFVVHSNSFLGH